ncbi:hypothetical protein HYU18_05320 [Candidatus Woesearchaeota archaeon]|nr:hypothetical protein [Candidatus Woesearchaeota archaeon]
MQVISNKKAQGLSLSTVIIAIIVLVVLVVLVMIFTGYFGKIFTPSVSSCAQQGGSCVATTADCTTSFGETGKTVYVKECETGKPVCCLKGQ